MTVEIKNDKWEEWTSCEWNGHDFLPSEENPNVAYCQDCGERYCEGEL